MAASSVLKISAAAYKPKLQIDACCLKSTIPSLPGGTRNRREASAMPVILPEPRKSIYPC